MILLPRFNNNRSYTTAAQVQDSLSLNESLSISCFEGSCSSVLLCSVLFAVYTRGLDDHEVVASSGCIRELSICHKLLDVLSVLDSLMGLLRIKMPPKLQLLALLAFAIAMIFLENQIQKLEESRGKLGKIIWNLFVYWNLVHPPVATIC